MTLCYNGKAENEMTKDEILDAIIESVKLIGIVHHIKLAREAMDLAFSAGWRAGEKYANDINRIERKKEQERKEKKYE